MNSPTATMIATSVVIFGITIASLLIVRTISVLQSIQKNRRHSKTKSRGSQTASPPDSVYGANGANNANRAKDVGHNSSNAQLKRTKPKAKTLVFLGSGGHTTEMIHLLQELDPEVYSPVVYVVADSDVTSIPRLREFISKVENDKSSKEDDGKHVSKNMWLGRCPRGDSKSNISKLNDGAEVKAEVHRLPRAREVNQSYFSSLFTTIHSFVMTLYLVWAVDPDLVLCNGPGTCVPIIYSVVLFRLLGLSRLRKTWKQLNQSKTGRQQNYQTNNCYEQECKTVFVESLCRVKTLSLSGKLVYPVVDQFVVHWPYLKEKYHLVEVCDMFILHDGVHG